MIYIAFDAALSDACHLTKAAFTRSFTSSQVTLIDNQRIIELFATQKSFCVVLVSNGHSDTSIYDEFIKKAQHYAPGVKIILFGSLPGSLAVPANMVSDATCAPAASHSFSESALRVHYEKPLGDQPSPITTRAFLRYDFTNEWNNLGFGAITCDGSLWSLAGIVDIPAANRLASVKRHDEIVSAYAGVWDDKKFSFLWFNRAVGPIDSQEWRLVEYFIASYRHEALPCLPAASEIPAGYDAVVTMRLDCDEDIESSRALFNCYQLLQVPFSLAIHTAVLGDDRHLSMMSDVMTLGGTILSHSATHPVNWGGSFAAAYQEATQSATILKQLLGDNRIKYAVSPFHQTPLYALQALAKAGYFGCVGGIVSSDPEFLIARGGELRDCPAPFIGHSQSCMFHGECLLDEADSLRVYKEAFNIAKRGRALFGYLDHPFSDRYAYGWQNEEDRIQAHAAFIAYMRTQGRVLFLNENDALDFIRYKSAIKLSVDQAGDWQCELPTLMNALPIQIEYRGEFKSLTKERVFA